MAQKSVGRSSESRVELASKRQIWSILFLFEIYDHVPKGKFGPDLDKNLDQTCLFLGSDLERKFHLYATILGPKNTLSYHKVFES